MSPLPFLHYLYEVPVASGETYLVERAGKKISEKGYY